MKIRTLLFAVLMSATLQLQAQADGRYVEVTGTSEIEIVPDKIHYLIEIREYFKEEFDGKSKPEDYRTKVPLEEIEQGLRRVLAEAGNNGKRIKILCPGALRGLVDHLLQLRRGLQAVVHQVQAGGGR